MTTASQPANPYQHARNLILMMLGNPSAVTRERIREVSTSAVMMLGQLYPDTTIDPELIIKHVETAVNVVVGPTTQLTDPEGHEEWLAARRGEIEWRFWDRYRHYLQVSTDLAPAAIHELDEVTNRILRLLEDPRRKGCWDRRGLVVGQVQSGKTGNYTGLIAKAIDAGYKTVIVLAGIHNSLRSQTQLRLDDTILGFDTQKRMKFDQTNVRMGVGLLPGFPLYAVNSLTNSSESGDFRAGVARGAGVMLGGDPVLLVVKKNKTVLNHVLNYLSYIHQEKDPSGRTIVRGVPLLVIDDEADSASVNTKYMYDSERNLDPDADPTQINRLIRKLLYTFDQSAYVGYTATPFANIFIHDQMTHEKVGDDLFPRSFIINLTPPSNYLGPARLFGLEADPRTGAPSQPPLPLVRTIEDYKDWMPDGHKKEWQLPGMPKSLHRALRSFVLTCAARAARRQERAHHSMLVHVTRYVAVQGQVYDQIETELKYIQQRLKWGDGPEAESLVDELHALWDDEYVPVSAEMNDGDAAHVSWEDLKEHLFSAASKIEMRKINGSAKDALQYSENPLGLSVIAVGGDKLSRGLTLEGLSVSYYLRASQMYDTLMQMGRWFGYRPGYLDLCRLFTSPELIRYYREVAASDMELREAFNDMAALDATPKEYGLGVRTHPGGLLVTARAKMHDATTVRVSFAGLINETVIFSEKPTDVRWNLDAFLELMGEIGQPGESRGYHLWENVPGELIRNFFAKYRTHPDAKRTQSDALRRYITSRLNAHELTHWTVALASRGDGANNYTIGGLDVGLIQRSRNDRGETREGIYSIQRLVSPRDEWIDLSDSEFREAVASTRQALLSRGETEKAEEVKEPSGLAVRRARPATRGLLLIYPLDPQWPDPALPDDAPVTGVAVSFPKGTPGNDSAVEYVVNNVYVQNFGGDV